MTWFWQQRSIADDSLSIVLGARSDVALAGVGIPYIPTPTQAIVGYVWYIGSAVFGHSLHCPGNEQ